MKIKWMFYFIIIGLFSMTCQKSNTHLSETTKIEITKEIESIHHEIIQAYYEHDAAKIVYHIEQTEDIHYVEHTQVTIGWNTLKKGWEQWHAANQNLSANLDQSYVNVLSKDIAVLVTAGVINKDNKKFQNYTWTAVFQRKGADWKIVNAHEAFSRLGN